MDLNQVTISSIDVKKSIEFYKILGLRLIVDSIPRYARFECPDGNSTFSIHSSEEPPIGRGTTIYFEDDNLNEIVKNLIEKGIEFTQLPEDKIWLWREAHLKDPDGNNIILFKAGRNRKYPSWRID